MEKTKEEQFRIVLSNFDVVREQKNTLDKKCKVLEEENERLKTELAQQKAVYKNMLDRYSGKEAKDLGLKYQELKSSYKEMMDDRSRVIQDNKRMRGTLDSIRGLICGAHNKLDDLCQSIGIEYHVKKIGMPTEETLSKVELDIKKHQGDQFIKYIRTIVDTYHKTGGLSNISLLARKFGVTNITKIQFFQYALHKEPLTDAEILEVYENVKRKGDDTKKNIHQ